MIDINLNNISLNFGFGEILNNISLEIKHGEKICLVGDNGSGKSTVLKIIMGLEKPTSGSINLRRNISIGYLSQTTDINNQNMRVKDILYQSLDKILKMEKTLEDYENKMALANSNELNKLISKYTNLQEQFINSGGYEINSRIGKIVNGFNIKDLLNKNYNDLSGGEKRIVSFAAIMIKNPDVLLLDEPTNYLDIDTLEWLEEYLNNYKETVLLVSHDRYFLDQVANKIIYLNNGKIDIYNGNYSYFLEEDEKKAMLEFKEYKDQQKQIIAMQNSIKKLRQFGYLGDDGRFFKRAKAIEKRLEKMEKLAKPKTKKSLPLQFNMNARSGEDVLIIKDLSLMINSQQLLAKANMTIKYQDCVCLMGKNGSGKTTLIKEILNNNPKIKLGSNINIGYIPQEIIFDQSKTIYEIARQSFKGEETHLRSALNKFMFSKNDIFKKVTKLSGGEKVRLKLFCLMQKEINFLLLDEPTNHIDINTREVLEDTLEEFKGTILFVSHDRTFINKLANKIIVIENQNLKEYYGNYNDYKDTLVRQNKL